MKPAMHEFQLVYQPLGSGALLDRVFRAPGSEEAFAIAAELIAESHGMAGAYVAFDRAGGRVTVGAGYRSRRGSFRLERLDPQPMTDRSKI